MKEQDLAKTRVKNWLPLLTVIALFLTFYGSIIWYQWPPVTTHEVLVSGAMALSTSGDLVLPEDPIVDGTAYEWYTPSWRWLCVGLHKLGGILNVGVFIPLLWGIAAICAWAKWGASRWTNQVIIACFALWMVMPPDHPWNLGFMNSLKPASYVVLFTPLILMLYERFLKTNKRQFLLSCGAVTVCLFFLHPPSGLMFIELIPFAILFTEIPRDWVKSVIVFCCVPFVMVVLFSFCFASPLLPDNVDYATFREIADYRIVMRYPFENWFRGFVVLGRMKCELGSFAHRILAYTGPVFLALFLAQRFTRRFIWWRESMFIGVSILVGMVFFSHPVNVLAGVGWFMRLRQLEKNHAEHRDKSWERFLAFIPLLLVFLTFTGSWLLIVLEDLMKQPICFEQPRVYKLILPWSLLGAWFGFASLFEKRTEMRMLPIVSVCCLFFVGFLVFPAGRTSLLVALMVSVFLMVGMSLILKRRHYMRLIGIICLLGVLWYSIEQHPLSWASQRLYYNLTRYDTQRELVQALRAYTPDDAVLLGSSFFARVLAKRAVVHSKKDGGMYLCNRDKRLLEWYRRQKEIEAVGNNPARMAELGREWGASYLLMNRHCVIIPDVMTPIWKNKDYMLFKL